MKCAFPAAHLCPGAHGSWQVKHNRFRLSSLLASSSICPRPGFALGGGALVSLPLGWKACL